MKKLVSLILCMLLIFGTACLPTVSALPSVTQRDGDYYYYVENGEATLSSFTGSVNGVVTVPETVGGYPVTALGSYLYSYERKLTGAVIPDTVKNIGARVFYDTMFYKDRANWYGELLYLDEYLVDSGSLYGTIRIKEGTTVIADNIFNSKSMTSIVIPDSVENIGTDNFYSCSELKSFTVSENNKNYSVDENGILFNKNKTILIKCPSVLSLDEYTVPDTVTTIKDFAFSETAVKKVVMPDSVTKLGENAFTDSSIEEIVLSDNITDIPDYTFYRCESLRFVTLGNKLKTIGSYAFCNCDLQELNLPDSLESIGTAAFSLNAFVSVVIPKNITELPDEVFRCCGALRYVFVKGHLERIGYEAFTECFSFRKLFHEFNYDDSCIDIFNGNEVLLHSQIYAFKNSVYIEEPSLTQPLKYGNSVQLTAVKSSVLGDNTSVIWSSEDNVTLSVGNDGLSCIVTPSKDGKELEAADIYCSVVDEEGKLISISCFSMNVDCRWYQKIFAFFRMIFGLSVVYM